MSPFSPEHLRPPWGRRSLAPGETVHTRVGPLHLWIRSEAGEIRIAHRHDEPEEAGAPSSGVRPTSGAAPPAGVSHPTGTEHPSGTGQASGAEQTTGTEHPSGPEAAADEDALEWVRWATGEDEVTGVEIRPRLPDRAVVVQPEQAFHLLPGARVRIYVRVPLRVQVLTHGPTSRPLVELPTVQLSDTWWGDFLTGELCYYLPISARRRIEAEHFLPHAAVAPLDFRNRAEEDLVVEKLALRVVHLGLFQADAGLWTDVTRAQYRGEALGSDLETGGRAPEEAGDAPGVGEPRVPQARGFRARTFARLWSLGGVGG